ncbi:MAG: isoprenylcysteine carboxylmethyltransferase family protein [Planctomycetaceae bacterium]|nr:isoprenylcysteine carboxylmethyltransferase family protein [Planctomycetaceae bacterium]
MERIKNPAVHFPPPTLFVLVCLCGSAIESAVPVPLSSLLALPGQTIIGWSAVALGAALLLWGLMTFIKVKTAIYPNQAAAELVAHGPYRFSRNPMYVGLTAMTLGVSLLADNLWMLMLLPVAIVVLTRFVIEREERYLTDAFGDSYRHYQACVRRWL